jgi:acetyl/propionyl-CoA carboxylase alpha subunit
MISALLIANRGEIARRIIRTARRMGVTTVAVYSDADAETAHVREADVAARLGPPPAAESYLNVEAILEAAALTGADAIHPGYGFLSENAEFAEACARAELIFVGPPPSAMRLLGRKDLAKAAMIEAGVPVVPGYHGADQSDATLKAAAKDVGWPVLIKAAAGGGGKGMRAVHAAKDFPEALAAARREAQAAFGDSDVILEKLIDRPRHIEVQVFGDAHGNVIHLFERDCSLQRRHQKVIEEAPAPGMTKAVRDAMCTAAVAAAKRAGYVNAGTIEFIADGSKGLRPDGFWFVEVNARLQVEHPVTEMITGLDLVELQLRVASGERLPAQEEIGLEGHAVEARVYAEDPASGFLPSIGPLAVFDLPAFAEPAGDGVRLRLDSGVEEGDAVRPHYDPMLAKAIAYATTRAAAADALAQALARTRIWPVRTNAGFLVRTLRDPDFFAGRVDTGFIAARQDSLCAGVPPETAAALGALVETLEGRIVGAAAADPWDARDGWRLNAPPRSASAFEVGDRRWDASVAGDDVSFMIAVGGVVQATELQLCDLHVGEGEIEVAMGDTAHVAGFTRTAEALVLFVDGEAVELKPPRADASAAAAEAGDQIRAPMPGRVLSVRAKAGQTLAEGDPVLVLEAMKMEHVLAAPRAGVLQSVEVAAGDQVAHGAVVARMESSESA